MVWPNHKSRAMCSSSRSKCFLPVLCSLLLVFKQRGHVLRGTRKPRIISLGRFRPGGGGPQGGLHVDGGAGGPGIDGATVYEPCKLPHGSALGGLGCAVGALSPPSTYMASAAAGGSANGEPTTAPAGGAD